MNAKSRNMQRCFRCHWQTPEQQLQLLLHLGSNINEMVELTRAELQLIVMAQACYPLVMVENQLAFGPVHACYFNNVRFDRHKDMDDYKCK